MSSTITVLERTPDATERRGTAKLRSQRAVLRALAGDTRRQVWVVRTMSDLAALQRAIASASPGVRAAYLLAYAKPLGVLSRVLESAFARAIIGAQAMLEVEDLKEVVRAKHPEDYCIAAAWEEGTNTLALWRGDFSPLVVPMSTFPTRGGTSPDPRDLSIEDCGQTVRMGEYECSVDALLIERDEEHRRRAKKRMIRAQQGLGPSIRRLRLMRGLSRSEIRGVAERTLARIERGEVGRPHSKTLRTIAKQLGVSVDELAGY